MERQLWKINSNIRIIEITLGLCEKIIRIYELVTTRYVKKVKWCGI